MARPGRDPGAMPGMARQRRRGAGLAFPVWAARPFDPSLAQIAALAPETGQRQAAELTALVAARPLSSQAWLSLAAFRLVARDDLASVLAALRVSWLTGPTRAACAGGAACSAWPLWEFLPADARDPRPPATLPARCATARRRSAGTRGDAGDRRQIGGSAGTDTGVARKAGRAPGRFRPHRPAGRVIPGIPLACRHDRPRNAFALNAKSRYGSVCAFAGACSELPMARLGRRRPAARQAVAATIAALFFCMLLADAAPGAGIGSPVIVVNTVTGTLKTQEPRLLRVGVDVFADEIVRTAEQSTARIVFEDQTKLEIGALSEVVLDRFVYDPNRSNSEVAVSIAKGIARFTTGVLAHESYKINTPTATIGVRGTTLDLAPTSAGLGSMSRSARVTVTANGVTVIVNAGQATLSGRRHAFRAGPTPLAAIRYDPDARPDWDAVDARDHHQL